MRNEKKWALLLLIISFLNSSYAYNTVDSRLASFILIASVAIVVLHTILLLLYGKRSIKRENLLPVIYCILIFLSLIINFNLSNIPGYLRLLMVITWATYFTTVVNVSTFSKIFINLMFWLGNLSLFFYIMLNTFGINLTFVKLINVNGNVYLSNFLHFFLEHDVSRNMSIFWEPGIFSTFLILAIIFEMIFNNKIHWFKMPLMILALITTKSTSGYFMIAALFIIIFRQGYVLKEIKIYAVLGIILAIAVLLVVRENPVDILAEVNPDVFGKIQNSTGSFLTRLNSPISDLYISKSNIFFGVGFRNYHNMWPDISSEFGIIAQTSTITYLGAVAGIISYIYFYLCLKSIFNLERFEFVDSVILCGIFVFILSKEPHQNNVIMHIALLYLYKAKFDNDYIKRKIKENKGELRNVK